MKSYQTMINGELVSSANTFEVKNPATGEVIGHAPISTASDVEAAVSAAEQLSQHGPLRQTKNESTF